MKPTAKRAKHVPNRFRREHLVRNAALAMCLVASGAAAVYSNQLKLSAGRGRSLVVLSDDPMWLALGAMVCGVLGLLAVVVDHLDRRDNERAYEAFQWISLRLGGVLLASALIVHFCVTMLR
jgi:hypothetical protein